MFVKFLICNTMTIKHLTLLHILLWTVNSHSQIGIGTITPTAEIEVSTTNTGIPAFELNPQSAPVGSATGQLAVIGDQLFMYDAIRTKWLSIGATAFTWSIRGNSRNEYLKFSGGGLRDLGTGAPMPFDGTIVYIAATSTAGMATKGFDILVRNGTTTNSTTTFNLVANNYSNTTHNINFAAGDYLNVWCQDDAVDVVDPTLTVWVKQRK
jgi:hypothetical protein